LEPIKQEFLEPFKYEYPRGYFELLFIFASKIVSLGISPDIPTAVRDYTSIPRRLYGKHNPLADDWPLLFSSIENFWHKYTSDKSHLYKPVVSIDDGCHIGSFIIKPQPGKPVIIDTVSGDQKVEIHFNNHRNTKGEFSRNNLDVMSNSLKTLFQNIINRQQTDLSFNPKFVSLRSWMNCFIGIKSVLPPEFVASAQIVKSTNFPFNSDSLWGQFLTYNGGINQKTLKKFLQNLKSAKSLEEIIDAFPFPVILFRSPLDQFYEFYSLKN
jgi:hypothetical protein